MSARGATPAADSGTPPAVAALRPAATAPAAAWADSVAQAAVGLALLDADSRVVIGGNPALAGLLGRAEADLAGARLDELTHPDDLVVLHAALAQLRGGERPSVQYGIRLLDAAGRPVDALVTHALVLTPPGEPDLVLMIARGTGELRLLQEQLRAERDLGEAVLYGAGTLIVVLADDGRVLRWNGRCEQLFGVPARDAVGRPVGDLLGQLPGCASLTTYLTGLADATEPVAIAPAGNQVITCTGAAGARAVSWSSSLLDTALGRLWVAVGTDVTEVEQARRALLDSEQRFRALVQNGSDIVVLADADWRLRYVSPAGQRQLGHEFGSTYGTPLSQFVHDEDLDALRAAVAASHDEPGGVRLQLRVRHIDGGWRVLETYVSDELDDPAVQAIVFNARDVTERAQAERLVTEESRVLEMIARGQPLQEILRATLALAAQYLPEARCVIHLLAENGEQLELAASSNQHGGFEGVPIMPVGPLGGACGTAAQQRRTTIVADLAADVLTRHTRRIARTHGVRSAWCTPMLDSTGGVHGVLSVYRSSYGGPTAAEPGLLELFARLATTAVEHDKAERALAHQALHDPLTGLANRFLLLTELEHALARAARAGGATGVLVLDLDRFKLVNDTFGHARGDALLIRVAEAIRAAVRPGDTVARLGGDEFVVLCEDLVGPQDAMTIAARLVAELAAPVTLDGEDVFPAVSVGVALAAAGQAVAEDMLRDADAAMHRAKRSGGGRVELFDGSLQQHTVHRWDLETGLHTALARDELRVHYQPQVEVTTGRIVGVEALLRWFREGGVEPVPPTTFVPVAEETGLIVPIGEWVLRQACRDGAALVAAGHPTKISVNLSARQLAHPGLPDDVAAALADSGLPARLLCLEVTETVLMDDAPALLATLRQLRELGVTIAIDDFGTGYSSLLYLKRLPVGTLKIDLSFVAGLDVDPEDRAIVSAIVQLAGSLDLDVVAEGVETERQRVHLADLGCRHAQGFLFAHPMPFDALLARAAASPAGELERSGRRRTLPD